MPAILTPVTARGQYQETHVLTFADKGRPMTVSEPIDHVGRPLNDPALAGGGGRRGAMSTTD